MKHLKLKNRIRQVIANVKISIRNFHIHKVMEFYAFLWNHPQAGRTFIGVTATASSILLKKLIDVLVEIAKELWNK